MVAGKPWGKVGTDWRIAFALGWFWVSFTWITNKSDGYPNPHLVFLNDVVFMVHGSIVVNMATCVKQKFKLIGELAWV